MKKTLVLLSSLALAAASQAGILGVSSAITTTNSPRATASSCRTSSDTITI